MTGDGRTIAPIRVLLVAGVRLYRDGLAGVITRDGGLQLVGAVSSVGEAAMLAESASVEVALVDVLTTPRPAELAPLRIAAPKMRLVVLGVREVEDEVLAWAEGGVSGYVTHDSELEAVVEAVRRAARRELVCSPRIACALLERLGLLSDRVASQPVVDGTGLTPRERQVAVLIAEGLSNKEISRRLGVSFATTKNHVHNALGKLGVERRGDVGRLLSISTGAALEASA
jgi:two-component system, NarL family, nitrate/nitrite response regulator NarL